MSEVSIELRITSIRSVGKFGGVIFAGITASKEYYVTVCSNKIIPDATIVSEGQEWSVTGALEQWKGATQIKASAAELLYPSGHNIIDWIVRPEHCAGIRRTEARALYEEFGPALINHISFRNVDALTKRIRKESARALCDAFEKYRTASILLWLSRLAIDRRMGKKIIGFFGDLTQRRIEENPYRLISFAEEWQKVDLLAKTRFTVQADDPRRLDAAVEEALYRGMRDGHTCLPIANVKARLRGLLEDGGLIAKALALVAPSTQYHRLDGILQSSGAYVMERYVADRLVAASAGELEGVQRQQGLKRYESSTVDEAIAAFEASQSLVLTAEQRSAVITAVRSHLSLIAGGVGTGKATVLKAIYSVLENVCAYKLIHQMTLTDRAAQRMSQATGKPSMTIAAFLNEVDAGTLGPNTAVVIGEMSMVDLIWMYRALRRIPSGTKLILVGDPSQLPPMGLGLVLHVLAGHPMIRQTELKVAKRQSAVGGIPFVAAAIREHRVPQHAEYDGIGTGVSFVQCSESKISEDVRRVYGELGGDGSNNSVQILSITQSGNGGTEDINRSFHEEFRRGAPMCFTHHPFFGRVGAHSMDRVPLRVGDPVVYTADDDDLGPHNGSLGTIVEALDSTSREHPCCAGDFDGIRYELSSSQAETLRHAYAIPIQKSQGGRFQRVIVSLRKSTLLDQALIYTAITRGVDQVVLVGDWDSVCAAIKAPATAARRHVNLPSFLAT
ncbi:AAA family ATPase [Noviherbaspirillum pedocola]|uniref:AAA family ATPase n=1 Tax=Noviherbaspirillum pedocola TaxID=2801341 RepID=A0A934W6T6_9BURK|nr:AAA family ATPase [Noviherbaspirillum pedocola]MBK4735535.1 AAA family ATPase [Noviherbaspirillum pedocola]